MANFDLTMSNFLVPGLRNYQPKVGKLKSLGVSLTTLEVVNNMATPYTRVFTMTDGDTVSGPVEADCTVIYRTSVVQQLDLTSLKGSPGVRISLILEGTGSLELILTSGLQQTTHTLTPQDPVAQVYPLNAGGVQTGWVVGVRPPEIPPAPSQRVVGEVIMFVGSVAPGGWLLCDGQTYSADDYPELYDVLHDLPFNSGLGSGQFKVPDMRGLFPQGANGDLGQSIDAGLPEITGMVYGLVSLTPGASGSLSVETKSTHDLNGSGSGATEGLGTIQLDASRSNSIYGGSTTVQPPAFAVNYLIKY